MAVTQASSSTTAEPSAFVAERARLVTDIKLEMGHMVANINILQRNLETIVNIGSEFEQLAHLWKHFHASAFQNAEDDIYQSQDAE
ncbi:hypothetical protein KVV02_004771 [Mortierella alpina]|uniref:DASH complex subunit DAD1 n=1 Tax=Mortierella alpina TaxID=64518 RepID=A0A9P8A6X7_MORAP|nr:hypothetical protein KVV02_004771 [Mortierella alpina]